MPASEWFSVPSISVCCLLYPLMTWKVPSHNEHCLPLYLDSTEYVDILSPGFLFQVQHFSDASSVMLMLCSNVAGLKISFQYRWDNNFWYAVHSVINCTMTLLLAAAAAAATLVAFLSSSSLSCHGTPCFVAITLFVPSVVKIMVSITFCFAFFPVPGSWGALWFTDHKAQCEWQSGQALLWRLHTLQTAHRPWC